jgi:hypothetical protein
MLKSFNEHHAIRLAAVRSSIATSGSRRHPRRMRAYQNNSIAGMTG